MALVATLDTDNRSAFALHEVEQFPMFRRSAHQSRVTALTERWW